VGARSNRDFAEDSDDDSDSDEENEDGNDEGDSDNDDEDENGDEDEDGDEDDDGDEDEDGDEDIGGSDKEGQDAGKTSDVNNNDAITLLRSLTRSVRVLQADLKRMKGSRLDPEDDSEDDLPFKKRIRRPKKKGQKAKDDPLRNQYVVSSPEAYNLSHNSLEL
jgi:hypothetical protein